MVMGDRGMHDMAEMEMPLPDNTVPMMTGQGPFGAMGMGGMFSVVKVRRDQPPGHYKNPGWYAHPPGTVAYEYQGEWQEPLRQSPQPSPELGHETTTQPGLEVQVQKPKGSHNH